jgi:hypothetical protein
MLKIAIIGSSGSGKTTLAGYLSTRLHIPHYELDEICRRHGAQMAAYIDDAIALAEQPGWIAEGNFIIWTDPLFYRADYIVFLEISWLVSVWRIISRHISKSLRGVNPYPGINGLRLLLLLLKGVRRYHLDNVQSDPSVAESARQFLAEHEADRELADAETLIGRWQRCQREIPFTVDFAHMYLKKYQEKVIFVSNAADRERLLKLLMSSHVAV